MKQKFSKKINENDCNVKWKRLIFNGINFFSFFLVSVIIGMLVYQLLSHERKKMIWEQLELRRRQAYGRQSSPPGWPPLANGPSIIGTPRNGPCRCCEQCHSHRNMMQPSYSWDNDNRFWSPPPNGAYYTQGNFFSSLDLCTP